MLKNSRFTHCILVVCSIKCGRGSIKKYRDDVLKIHCDAYGRKEGRKGSKREVNGVKEIYLENWPICNIPDSNWGGSH
jgi:hypothetical protein